MKLCKYECKRLTCYGYGKVRVSAIIVECVTMIVL